MSEIIYKTLLTAIGIVTVGYNIGAVIAGVDFATTIGLGLGCLCAGVLVGIIFKG